MKNINEIKSEKQKGKTLQLNPLIDAMDKNSSRATTLNGATTYNKSGSFLLDFFAQAGSMRDRDKEAINLFSKAYGEDYKSAIKILFYLRDIRGGQGERKLFRNCIQWIGDNEKSVFEKIIEYIPEYGRWDDMFFDNAKVFDYIKKQLSEDINSENPSLLAKWLPTINASSENTKEKARFFAKNLGMTDIDYRKTVRKLRERIKTVEEKMSKNEWSDIDYSKVPSRSSMIYKNAFKKHDKDRYNKFVEDAKSGKEKINSGTLYPYEIYNKVKYDYSETLEALWNQLPDYTQNKNAIVVADVSGSMDGNPMAVSVSLALYFAERNHGPFKDCFITFSDKPKIQKVIGRDLKQRMKNLERSEWGISTNLQAVFDLILGSAVKNNIGQENMPETIYIISDMEFDSCVRGVTNFESIKNKYEKYGYKKPNVVFWNVDSKTNNLPVRKNESDVALVSGLSPSVFKLAVENVTPEQFMYNVINSERYSKIKF